MLRMFYGGGFSVTRQIANMYLGRKQLSYLNKATNCENYKFPTDSGKNSIYGSKVQFITSNNAALSKIKNCEELVKNQNSNIVHIKTKDGCLSNNIAGWFKKITPVKNSICYALIATGKHSGNNNKYKKQWIMKGFLWKETLMKNNEVVKSLDNQKWPDGWGPKSNQIEQQKDDEKFDVEDIQEPEENVNDDL